MKLFAPRANYGASLFVIAAILGTASPLSAQTQQPKETGSGEEETDNSRLEEIIVVAQKRTERLQDVPISITALTADMIEKRGVRNLSDVSQMTPNFQLDGGKDSNENKVSLRGISSAAIITGQPETVGIYIDGVYNSGRILANLDLIDIERIEVLRGPQGTLFGRNTTAGAINITTHKAGNDFEGSLQAEYGNYDTLRLRGGVGGPIATDSLFAQVSGTYSRRSGYQRNTTLNIDTDANELGSGRFSLSYRKPDSPFAATLTGDYYEDNNAAQVASISPFTRKVTTDIAPIERNKSYGSTLTLTYDFDSAILTSISSFKRYDLKTQSDFDRSASGNGPLINLSAPPPVPGGPPPALGFGYQGSFENGIYTSKQYSQEIRLHSAPGGKLDWILSGFFYKEKLFVGSDLQFAFSIPTPLGPLPAPGFIQNNFDMDSVSYALFGQATWHMTDKLHLTGGGRVTRDEKDFVTSAIDPTTISPANPLGIGIPQFATPFAPRKNGFSGTRFTPMANLRFELNDDASIYASFATGYKEGTVNQTTVPAGARTEVLPETSNSYEVGVKSVLADRRLQINANVFYIDYKNLQVTLTNPLSGLPYVGNAGARSYGFEADMNAVVAPGVTLGWAVGFTDAKYRSFPACSFVTAGPAAGTPISCNGNQLANGADWTASANFRVIRPIGNGLSVSFGGDVNYRGRTYFDPENALESKRSPYALVNGDIGLLADGWSLSVFTRNLFDKDYIIQYNRAVPVFGQVQSPYYYAGAPRTVGVRLKVDF
ncbi:MAG: TonB-dependent receptor [Sphingomonadaceae bacterium]|nr:TonB-dependent receptor [Sphingomonadaceae bacterium]